MHTKYQNPLASRYSSDEMLYNFSPQMKFITWRKLWLALAEIQKDIGLDISDEQLEEIRKNIDNIYFEVATIYDKKFYHVVMAYVHTLGYGTPISMLI